MKENISSENEYESYRNANLNLDMSRGKPSMHSFDTMEALLGVINKNTGMLLENGIDCRNYVCLTASEAKGFFASCLSGA